MHFNILSHLFKFVLILLPSVPGVWLKVESVQGLTKSTACIIISCSSLTQPTTSQPTPV